MSDMRIGGLASGMDIDKLVTNLMKAERQPLNKMEQDKTWMTWKRDGYREVNKQLRELSELAFDMKLERSYNSKDVNSSSSAVTATANSTAYNGNYTINVTQMAEAAYRKSTSTISSGTLDPDARLKDQLGNFDNNTTSIGDTFKITTHNEDGTTNSKEFTVDGEKSLNELLSDISDSDLGVRAFYDKTADRVMFERTKTGDLNTSGSEFDFTGNFLTDNLALSSTAATTDEEGKDAIFKYNSMEITSHTNDYTLNGVNFKFHDTTGGADINVNISNDVDAAVDKIVEFVDKYNKVIEDLNGRSDEKKYRDFPPLTDKQKEAMEEKEIELWEEKAKSGMLRNDSVINGVLNDMRRNWYTSVESAGQYSQISEIGITTSSNYRDNGKLLIDEDELRQALSEDAESVYQIFSGTDEKPGVARRIETSTETAITSIERKAGKSTSTEASFVLGRRIEDLNKEMDDFEARLTQIEDRYWREFGAMEKAIQQMNSQSSFLMQNFS